LPADRPRATIGATMGPRTSRRLAWGIGLVSIALMLARLGLMYADRNAVLTDATGGLLGTTEWNLANVLSDVANLAVPIIGIVLSTRVPENRLGWMFLAAGAFLASASFCQVYAQHALVIDPGNWPGGEVALWGATWGWTAPIGLLALVILLFPTGELPSRAWRPLLWFTAIDVAALSITAMVYAAIHGVDVLHESEVSGTIGGLFALTFLGLVIALIACVASVGVRFRAARGAERLQLKGFLVAALLVGTTFVVGNVVDTPLMSILSSLSLLLLWVSIAVAVVRYRLYDIDVVISKAVVFGALVAFITVVYVAVVVGVGALVGEGRSPLLAALAAWIVALAFQPVRGWARRLANRVVYGRRATPYEVLSEFSDQLAGTYSTDDVLPRMAQLVAAGTGAERTTVWLRVGGELRAEAWWGGEPDVRALPLGNGTLPPMSAEDAVVPVRHADGLLGAISVRMHASEPLGPEQGRLITDVASQAGLVLSNVRLIEELRASRQRLVAAQDAERRKLERDLHDGAQQQFVAVGIKARLVEGLIGSDQERARDLLREVVADTQGALENLRDLAHGIYPPVLADQGLAAAVAAHARKVPVPVDVEVAGTGRFPQEIEAAVYFCCLEALQNIAKYAEATHADVRIGTEDGSLVFTVADDGRGFDPAAARGAGLQSMRDRLDALGGSLEVRSAPGAGSRVTGRVPLG
jgi:signal transduction histidine kinase